MMNNVPLPMKSPAGRTPQKAYKHVKFMPLAHVRRVVDIRDNEGKQFFAGFPMFSANRGAISRICVLSAIGVPAAYKTSPPPLF